MGVRFGFCPPQRERATWLTPSSSCLPDVTRSQSSQVTPTTCAASMQRYGSSSFDTVGDVKSSKSRRAGDRACARAPARVGMLLFMLGSRERRRTRRWASLAAVAVAMASCTGGAVHSSSSSVSSSSSSGAGGAGRVDDVRDDRYCEILLGKISGTNVNVDVYNTYLLNDCPPDAWAGIDPNQIKSEKMVDAVILNGPRRWLMNSFVNSQLVDPKVVTFGSLGMRLAGQLVIPLSDVAGPAKPYTTRQVNRTTTWVYDAGTPVYELVDPTGRVFDMQSYSIAKSDMPESALAALGAQLMLPAGWTYRIRTLTTPLSVTAITGVATIVQDENENTYQLSTVAP